MLSNQVFKQKLLTSILDRKTFVERVSETEVRTRCPFCGDSQKNFHTGHFYIRISINDNKPVLYNCFKCPAKGVLNSDVLELLDLDLSLVDGLNKLNKTADKSLSGTSEIFNKEILFDYKLPKINYGRKIEYIENRLGFRLTEEDCIKMKVIPSLRDFLLANGINTITCKANMARYVEAEFVGFLSTSNGHILFRSINEKSDIRWFKYPITTMSKNNKIFYTISNEIDLYSKDKITINLAEGVLDTISIYKNFFNNEENTLNMSICGKYYANALKYIISKGFIGSNININIFVDNDKTKDTSKPYLESVLSKYKDLVGSISLYYNLKSKDCGVPREKIKLTRFKL